MSRIKLFNALGELDEVKKLNSQTDEVKSELENTMYFQTLSDKKKIQLLKGQSAFLKSHDELILASNDSISNFRFKYIHLSNLTHSFPMAFYRLSQNNLGFGVESQAELERVITYMGWATECIQSAIKDYESMWNK
jgi:hypothetical protein